MTTKHKMLATIPMGDPDLGAECEALIYFTHRKGSSDYYSASLGSWQPGWDSEIEFHSAAPYCNGKPSPFYGAFADLEQEHLNDIARDYLESVEGYRESCATVRDDYEAGREFAADIRADR